MANDNKNEIPDVLKDLQDLTTSPAEKELSQDEAREFYKLTFPEHTVDTLVDVMNKLNDKLGEDEFLRQLQTVGSYTELVKRMWDAHTDQAVYIREALERIKDTTKVGDSFSFTPSEDDPDKQPFELKSKLVRLDKSLKGADLDGHQAKMMILAANRNIKKIYLYNSGFSIVLRAPSMLEVNLVYNRISENMDTYGRMLGAVFYLYSDFKHKELIWDFMSTLIIGSNLNKWDKGNRLRDNVSLADYQSIMLSICSLMYKSGYEFTHVCANEACKQVTTEVIDLDLLQLTDFSKIPYEILGKLAANKAINPDDVRSYKKTINVDRELTIDRYRVYRKVPSISEYISSGRDFNEELFMQIQDISNPKIIDEYLIYNYSYLFESWISHIEYLDENGEVSFRVTDREAVTLLLNEFQKSDFHEAFVKKMTEYIQDNTVTNIGYLATPCPTCGVMPTNVVNGFVPLDIQKAFFSILVMQLIQKN